MQDVARECRDGLGTMNTCCGSRWDSKSYLWRTPLSGRLHVASSVHVALSERVVKLFRVPWPLFIELSTCLYLRMPIYLDLIICWCDDLKNIAIIRINLCFTILNPVWVLFVCECRSYFAPVNACLCSVVQLSSTTIWKTLLMCALDPVPIRRQERTRDAIVDQRPGWLSTDAAVAPASPDSRRQRTEPAGRRPIYAAARGCRWWLLCVYGQQQDARQSTKGDGRRGTARGEGGNHQPEL